MRGIEPLTSCLQSRRSPSELHPRSLMGILGFEPRTSALSELRSSQLSYIPFDEANKKAKTRTLKPERCGTPSAYAPPGRVSWGESYTLLARQSGFDEIHSGFRISDFDDQLTVSLVLQLDHYRVIRIVNIPGNPLAILIKSTSG